MWGCILVTKKTDTALCKDGRGLFVDHLTNQVFSSKNRITIWLEELIHVPLFFPTSWSGIVGGSHGCEPANATAGSINAPGAFDVVGSDKVAFVSPVNDVRGFPPARRTADIPKEEEFSEAAAESIREVASGDSCGLSLSIRYLPPIRLPLFALVSLSGCIHAKGEKGWMEGYFLFPAASLFADSIIHPHGVRCKISPQGDTR